MFHLSVCLSVCEQDISKSCGRIQTKLGGQVGCLTMMNQFNFGEDPDPDSRLFFYFSSDSSPSRGQAKNDIWHDISKKLWTGSDKTWLVSCGGDKNKPILFSFRSGYRSVSVGYKM